jgi:uncharacterized protein YigE (DUF2233 family)
MIRLAACLLIFCAAAAQGAQCRKETYQGNNYTLCVVDMTREDLRLFLWDENNTAYGHFGNIATALNRQGKRLGFAMNAGMYHEDRSPVGQYIENGDEQRGVISNAGPGNFGLLPNGILCLRHQRADVIETLRYLAQEPMCDSATQSGPMLVIEGALHPRFLQNSTSKYIRNGVGTSADGKQAVFVISDNTVNFYAFAQFFRDFLKLPNALYLDGNVSRMRAPDLGRDDAGFSALGPIIGVVQDAE